MASDWPLGSTWPRNCSRGEVPKRELKASDVLRSMLRVLETGADASDAELRLWMAHVAWRDRPSREAFFV